MTTAEALPASHRSLVPVLALALVLAACSILYELLAAQTLSVLAANTVIWYSLVVGLYLASMGVGAFFSEKLTAVSPWRILLRLELLLTVIGCLTVPLIRSAHTVFSQLQIHGDLAMGLVIFYCVVVPIVLVLGVLTGMELPLLMRLARKIRDTTRSANQALGWDYLGSLVGAMLFPLVILPTMTLIAAGLLIATINLLVAAWIAVFRLGLRSCLPEVFCMTMIVAALLATSVNLPAVNQYFLKRYFFYTEMENTPAGWFAPRPDLPDVFQTRSPYQVINLIRNPSPAFHSMFLPAYSNKLGEHPDFPVDYLLYLNGSPQTDTRYEEIYHEWFAHLPVTLAGSVPGKVLVLGGGDGFLVRELLKYDGVEQIRQVDIDAVLIEFAKTNEVLRRVNQGALSDPRVDIRIDDAYQYVRQSHEVFDAVYIDLPVANTYDLAKLYSREFYEFVRQRLAPGGYVVFDASNIAMLEPADESGTRALMKVNPWPVYASTLKLAGFETVVPYFSTLETDNEEVARIVGEQKFTLTPTKEAELATVKNPVLRELRRRAALTKLRERLQGITSQYLQQGFIFMTPASIPVEPRTALLPADLYVLNAERVGLAFTHDLPIPEIIDRSKVNSIVRPTLPVTPWWRPMTSF